MDPRGERLTQLETDYHGESEMRDLIERIARALVDRSEEVQVSEVSGESTVAIELRVSKEDLGQVIGKKGRTAVAMRTILNAAGSREGKRYVLEILE